ncbi:MAG: choice-of-anchor L domain-containing protein [Bacteroidota bacterium]
MGFEKLSIFTLLLLLVLSKGQVNAQIRTIADSDVERLVEEVFIKGDCANVSNIRSIGNLKGLGYFEGGAPNIGMERGLIIASGDVAGAQGPNQSEGWTSQFNDGLEDIYLKGLSTGVLYDNVGIEFDFIPQKERVSFRYVFASEEYCEFVGSVFNDVFGFFVSGPGINGPFENGAINVALIPETNDLVSINSVNHRFNSEYYVKNELLVDANQCGISFNPLYINEVEYDGFTVVLEAVFEVIPCETYTIRLIVGDVGDDKLDSAVFLEAQSFDIGPQVEVNFIPEIPTGGRVLVEGCNRGRVVFQRTDEVRFDEDLEVTYRFTDRSNATAGIDFPTLPNPIIIPANETSVSFPLEAFPDNINEQAEIVAIELDIPCNCTRGDNTLVRLQDPVEMTAIIDTTVLCKDEPGEVEIQLVEGTGGYRYTWETGDRQNPLLLLAAEEERNYRVTVTDLCNDTLIADMPVVLIEQGKAQLSGVFDWCPGTSLEVPINLSGQPPWALEYQLGDSRIFRDNINSSPFFVPINQSGTLELTFFSDANCTGPISGSINVESTGPIANPMITPLECPGSETASIQLNIQSQVAYNVQWNVPVNDPERPTNLGAGTYQFVVTDVDGCTYRDQIIIEAPDRATAIRNRCVSFDLETNVYIPNAFSPDNDGNNDEFRIFTNPEIVGMVRSFRVFDRWGNLLFERRDFEPGDQRVAWDGTHRGQLLLPGIYIYSLEFEDVLGQISILRGNVALIR